MEQILIIQTLITSLIIETRIGMSSLMNALYYQLYSFHRNQMLQALIKNLPIRF